MKDKEREIKHKLRPHNAFLRAKDLDLPASHPREREELHQFLIGLYGEYVLPWYTYTQVLRAVQMGQATRRSKAGSCGGAAQ